MAGNLKMMTTESKGVSGATTEKTQEAPFKTGTQEREDGRDNQLNHKYPYVRRSGSTALGERDGTPPQEGG